MNRRRRAANRDSHTGGRGDGRGGADQPVDVRAWWGIGVPARAAGSGVEARAAGSGVEARAARSGVDAGAAEGGEQGDDRSPELIRPNPEPGGLPRSLGDPPLPVRPGLAEAHFVAVYEEAVRAATALAAANGLLADDGLSANGDSG